MKKLCKDFFKVMLGYNRAFVFYLKVHAVAGFAEPYDNLSAARREFNCVVNEVCPHMNQKILHAGVFNIVKLNVKVYALFCPLAFQGEDRLPDLLIKTVCT